jgi:tetratricopeptide (TPR) repeat protein
MRKLILVIAALLLPLLAVPLAVRADPYVDNALIDELFAELAAADNENEADGISRQIWYEWFSPNDVKLATRMTVATNLLGEGDPEGCLVELTHVVEEYPDYAEGWNQRATLYFRFGRYEDSLADIEKVLAIEPRHYGAMAGRVLIYLKQDRKLDALRQMREALTIHPYLNERFLFPELARDITHV